MKRSLVVLLPLLLSVFSVPQSSSPSFADIRKSGNMFLAKCESEGVASLDELSTKDFCRGYITGLSDGVEMAMISVPPSCPPEIVTPAQMGRIATKYMHDHPEKTHTSTPILIFEAWASAFPCPAKK
jgi:hypothetical protein